MKKFISTFVAATLAVSSFASIATAKDADLAFSMTSNKGTYAPGETVTLTVKITPQVQFTGFATQTVFDTNDFTFVSGSKPKSSDLTAVPVCSFAEGTANAAYGVYPANPVKIEDEESGELIDANYTYQLKFTVGDNANGDYTFELQERGANNMRDSGTVLSCSMPAPISIHVNGTPTPPSPTATTTPTQAPEGEVWTVNYTMDISDPIPDFATCTLYNNVIRGEIAKGFTDPWGPYDVTVDLTDKIAQGHTEGSFTFTTIPDCGSWTISHSAFTFNESYWTMWAMGRDDANRTITVGMCQNGQFPEAPTTAPTTEPTTAPTTEPTTAPTTEPTTAPTETPTAEVVQAANAEKAYDDGFKTVGLSGYVIPNAGFNAIKFIFSTGDSYFFNAGNLFTGESQVTYGLNIIDVPANETIAVDTAEAVILGK